jgi:hypothetical protein
LRVITLTAVTTPARWTHRRRVLCSFLRWPTLCLALFTLGLTLFRCRRRCFQCRRLGLRLSADTCGDVVACPLNAVFATKNRTVVAHDRVDALFSTPKAIAVPAVCSCVVVTPTFRNRFPGKLVHCRLRWANRTGTVVTVSARLRKRLKISCRESKAHAVPCVRALLFK